MALTARSPAASAKAACRRDLKVLPAGSRRCAVVVQAVQQSSTSRREVLGAVALSVSSLLVTAPAKAFLGLGEDNSVQDTYSTATASILTNVRDTLALPKDDPAKEDKVTELRKEINSWVATYRREPKVSGRPSYGQTYSVVNALAGHYNSFGATAPIPKKRLERINKELDDATLYLSRNR